MDKPLVEAEVFSIQPAEFLGWTETPLRPTNWQGHELPRLEVKREKTARPLGWFSIHVGKSYSPAAGVYAQKVEHYRCDSMHELSVFKHRIKRAYWWFALKQKWKTRRWDWWNAGK